MKTRAAVAIFAVIALAAGLGIVSAMPVGPESALEREVGHRLRMLPYYSVFDILRYSVSGYHVTLDGAVTQPWLKSDAEKEVKTIEGVEGVTNNIKVLPVSPSDDRIRQREYQATNGQRALFGTAKK